MSTAKFSLGQVVATPAALESIKASGQSPDFFLDQHSAGNWGIVGEEDWELNDQALQDGSRLLSAYLTLKGTKLWFHELAHWTQAQRRLSWRGTLEEGELRAEIASAFLCQIFGIPNAEKPTPNHQKYVDAWMTGMEADPWLIVRIAEQASEAVDFILSFSNPCGC